MYKIFKYIKLLEENIGISLCDLGLGTGFLAITLKSTNKVINWTLSKFLNFVFKGYHQQKLKKQLTE